MYAWIITDNHLRYQYQDVFYTQKEMIKELSRLKDDKMTVINSQKWILELFRREKRDDIGFIHPVVTYGTWFNDFGKYRSITVQAIKIRSNSNPLSRNMQHFTDGFEFITDRREIDQTISEILPDVIEHFVPDEITGMMRGMGEIWITNSNAPYLNSAIYMLVYQTHEPISWHVDLIHEYLDNAGIMMNTDIEIRHAYYLESCGLFEMCFCHELARWQKFTLTHSENGTTVVDNITLQLDNLENHLTIID